MSDATLIVFDTCTIPEYYDDVHKILAYPSGFIVTYDYQSVHVDNAAVTILDGFSTCQVSEPVVLAYIQARDYVKAGPPPASGVVLPEGALCTLTRLATLVAVRKVTQDRSSRYYLDLKLLGYPYDRKQEMAREIVAELRRKSSIPMAKWIGASEDPGVKSLFRKDVPDDQCFPPIVNSLGQKDSQFSRDTFWRVTRVTTTTKSLLPFMARRGEEAEIAQNVVNNRATSYFRSVDQSVLEFELQFHRARESDTADYRIRQIRVESSPKALADTFLNTINTRSYGRNAIALPVPATSSLSESEVRYLFDTLHHERDERKDFPYGPELLFVVKYRKWGWRVFLAVASICAASALLAWAAFASSIPTPTFQDPQPLGVRIIATVIAVLLTLYSYYLWSDDVSLDKARR